MKHNIYYAFKNHSPLLLLTKMPSVTTVCSKIYRQFNVASKHENFGSNL